MLVALLLAETYPNAWVQPVLPAYKSDAMQLFRKRFTIASSNFVWQG